MIAGQLQTEFGASVENAEVQLHSATPEYPLNQMTGLQGVYAFEDNPLLQDYAIKGYKNDNHKNGVTTLDMVLIQLHVLGTQTLDSPYKVIAADVNSDQKVSTIDLLELRKLILGIYDELPASESWCFVDRDQVFHDIHQPWPFIEVLEVQELVTSMMEEDFISIKVGDVNGSAVANTSKTNDVYSMDKVRIQTHDRNFETGDNVEVEVTSKDFVDIFGFQFTLVHNGLSLLDFVPGVLDIGADNIGHHNGLITMSWHSTSLRSLSPQDILFTLKFRASSGGRLSEAMNLGSKITLSEIYVGNKKSVHQLDLEFRTNGDRVEYDRIALYQNEPNPFSASTVIGFELRESERATLTVFDINGKIVRIIDGEFNIGYNEVILSKRDFESAGLYIYQLESSALQIRKKMIYLE